MLIAALSGRALAQAARRAGYVPLVADLFGDDDTRAAAAAACGCRAAWRAACRRAGARHGARPIWRRGEQSAGLVYGSGFEDRPGLLAALATRYGLLGNAPATVRTVKQPGVPGCAVRARRRAAPAAAIRCRRRRANGWRSAPGGSGGGHVRRLPAGDAGAARATTRSPWLPGRPVSAVFVADGRDARVLGFCEGWCDPAAAQPWRYGGAVRPAGLPPALEAALVAAVGRLAAAAGLVGLNSADFLVTDGSFVLLEINPRPGATLDLFGDGRARRSGCMSRAAPARCRRRCRRSRQPPPPRWCTRGGGSAGTRASLAGLDGGPPAPGAPGRRRRPALHRAGRSTGCGRRAGDGGAAFGGDSGDGGGDMTDTISVNARAWSMLAALCDRGGGTLGWASRAAAGANCWWTPAPATWAASPPAWRWRGSAWAGLAQVTVAPDAALPRWPWTVAVASSQPVLACLASQYAGWSLAHGEKPNAFFALGSGPARALARKEPLFADLGYADAADAAVLVLESGTAASRGVGREGGAGLRRARRRGSASPMRRRRALPAACRWWRGCSKWPCTKLHALHFPLERVLDGMGAAPLPPPHPDFVTAMGRTNDAIIFGGRVHLYVSGPAAEARALAEALPATTSRGLRPPVRRDVPCGRR